MIWFDMSIQEKCSFGLCLCVCFGLGEIIY